MSDNPGLRHKDGGVEGLVKYRYFRRTKLSTATAASSLGSLTPSLDVININTDQHQY